MFEQRISEDPKMIALAQKAVSEIYGALERES